MKRLFEIAAISLFLIFALVTPRQAHAADWVGTNTGTDIDAARKTGAMNKAAYSQDTADQNLIVSACQIGIIVGPNGCTNDQELAQKLMKKTALGNLATAIDTMYSQPPADLAYWIRDTGQTLGFIPRQAYAQQQGIGFRGLEPLLPVWKAFRNIAYMLLAIAMVVVGFLVMMRKQIDPKTVVTVQNSLPRIVIALILITFSYAIVGLMVDLMYIIMGFLSVIVQGALPGGNPMSINYANPGFWDFTVSIFGPVGRLNPLTNLDESKNVLDFAGKVIGGALFTASGVGPLFQFIILLAFLFAYVRLTLLLLNCYIQILLSVLTGPLQILIDVFPGANGFTSWIKNIVSNLAVFPVTAFMLMLGNAIGQQMGSKALWTPPFMLQTLGTAQLPLVGDVTFGGIGGLAELLITLGIVLAIPNVANNIKEMMKAKSPIDVGPGVIFGPLGKSVGTGLSAGYQFSMIGSFFGLGKGHPQKPQGGGGG